MQIMKDCCKMHYTQFVQGSTAQLPFSSWLPKTLTLPHELCCPRTKKTSLTSQTFWTLMMILLMLSSFNSWSLTVLRGLPWGWLMLFSRGGGILDVVLHRAGLEVQVLCKLEGNGLFSRRQRVAYVAGALSSLRDVVLGLRRQGMADNGCCCGLFAYKINESYTG